MSSSTGTTTTTRAAARSHREPKPAANRNVKPRSAAGPSASSVSQNPQQQQSLMSSKGSRSEAETMYERLRSVDKGDGSADVIGPKGLRQLFTDLGVSEDSLEMFVVLWRLGAARKGALSRTEWLVAMYNYGIDQMTQLRLKTTEWVQEVKENRNSAYTVMYNFLYDQVRGETERQMTVQSAVAAWTVLFKGMDAKLTESWLRWVSQEYRRPISRDLWRQAWLFLSHVKTVPNADFVHDGTSWPTAIDDFVTWCKAQA